MVLSMQGSEGRLQRSQPTRTRSSFWAETVCSHVSMDNERSPEDNIQSRARGSDDDEYQIYRTQAAELGWPIKSYEEWLNS